MPPKKSDKKTRLSELTISKRKEPQAPKRQSAIHCKGGNIIYERVVTDAGKTFEEGINISSQMALRSNPPKKKNDSDTEVESEELIKQGLVKKDHEWLFASSDAIVVIKTTSDSWPPKMTFSQKENLTEDSVCKLFIGGDEQDCRLLCKGPRKYLEPIRKEYQEEIDKGVAVSELKKKLIKALRNTAIIEDFDFLNVLKHPKPNSSADVRSSQSRTSNESVAGPSQSSNYNNGGLYESSSKSNSAPQSSSTLVTVAQSELSSIETVPQNYESVSGSRSSQSKQVEISSMQSLDSDGFDKSSSENESCDGEKFTEFVYQHKKRMSDLMNAFEIKMKQENKKKANLLSSIRGKVTFVT